MNVHDTIKQMMVEYPSLFHSRVEALHHLFWVNGNGYEWKDGELVSIDEPHPITIYETHKDIVDIRDTMKEAYSDPADFDAYVEKWKRAEKALKAFSKFIYENDDFVDTYRIELRSIYPLCEYAKILNVSEDVKPDWLTAARESVCDVELIDDFAKIPKATEWVAQAENCLDRFRF